MNRTLLCQIAEKVIGKKLKGVDWHSTKLITAIENTKIALDTLIKAKVIPQYYKTKVTEVIEGNNTIIVELLKKVKKVVESRSSRKNSIEVILDQRLKHEALNKTYLN
jgi:hypothetical protein